MTERKDYNYLKIRRKLAESGEFRTDNNLSSTKEREERIKQKEDIPDLIEIDSNRSGFIRNKKTGETVYNYKLSKRQLNLKG